MRRGEIAIGVVVIIALSLAVLITLATLLVSSGERARETLGACEDTHGGTCMTRQSCLAQDGRVIGGQTCTDEFTTEYDNSWSVQSYPTGGGVCCVTD